MNFIIIIYKTFIMRKLYSLYTSLVGIALTTGAASAQIPSGYYNNADGLSKNELKTALHQIISKANMLGYGSGVGKTWSGFLETDQSADGSVFDRYSNIKREFNGTNAVDGMNIEHSFPKSWWKGYENNAYRDLFHLYPSDGYTNNLKGNLPLGIVKEPASFDNEVSKIGPNKFGTTYTGSCFEPADEYKGDFARSYFYIVTAYEDFEAWWTSPMLDNNRWPVFNKWSVDLLLQWHREDPVNDLEQLRQEKVHQIQGNRNPYIDYPELVEYVWGKDTLAIYHFPEETAPFLTTPSRWERINMGIEMLNTRVEKQISFGGKNLTENIILSLKQNNGIFTLSSTNITAAAVNQGTEITLSFEATLPGYAYDTLIISSPELTEDRLIPITGLTAVDFMTLYPEAINATSATLNWMSVPNASNYLLDIYQGDLKAGNLIISKYIEGTSNNKAIELYNGTDKTIDLSRYSIKRQSNGNGGFSSELKLEGSLASGQTWLICHESAVESLKSGANMIVAANQGASAITFNGNDAIALYQDGIMIDLVGEKDNPSDWGKDCSLYRLSQVTHPSISFTWDQWVKKPIDTFEGIGSHTINFATNPIYIEQQIAVGINASYTCSKLMPEQTYTYRVTAKLSDGTELHSVNSSQCKTKPLEQPEILSATQITANSFIANWELVPDATYYLIDLFTLSDSEEQFLEEGFNAVGSKGTPLPEGWRGTASGNYTTEASSGKKPNSIALKSSGEWLQSPTFPNGISSLSFMYRFPSKGLGAYFTVEGLKGEKWFNIDTIYCENSNKTTLEYTPSQPFTTIRFTYVNKISGTNLALDDVIIGYGKPEANYIFQGQKAFDNEYLIKDLKENSVYNYQIRAGVGDYISDISDIMTVKTAQGLSVSEIKKTPFRYYISEEGIKLWNLPTHSQIRLIDMDGRIIYKYKSFEKSLSIPLSQKGIYILQCISDSDNYTLRIAY